MLSERLALRVEYRDAAALVAAVADSVLGAGRTFVLTPRDLAPGAPVRLGLTCPGLRQAIQLDGAVAARAPDGVEVAVDLDDSRRAALAELLARIRAGEPDVVLRTVHVLVVEDNPHVANLIRDGLTGGGRKLLGDSACFRFTTAANGREALDVLHAEAVDCVIADIYLPVMDGLQLIAEIRRDPSLRGLPVVAMSAGGPSVRPEAFRAGADHFLEKPMRLQEIVSVVRKVLGGDPGA